MTAVSVSSLDARANTYLPVVASFGHVFRRVTRRSFLCIERSENVDDLIDWTRRTRLSCLIEPSIVGGDEFATDLPYRIGLDLGGPPCPNPTAAETYGTGLGPPHRYAQKLGKWIVTAV